MSTPSTLSTVGLVVTVALAAAGLVVSVIAGVASVQNPVRPGAVLDDPAAIDSTRPASLSGELTGSRDRQRERRRDPARTAPAAQQRVGPAGDRARSRPAPRPRWLSVPGVGIDLPVRPVGVAEDGQMQLPSDPAVLGWYRYGPAPTEDGSAVLAAHVDSWEHGVGPLARLRDVEVGDTLVVGTTRGSVVHTVTSVDRYPKRALPASVFGRAGEPRIRVVTCGGEFDEAAGSYRENLVVTAEPRR